MYYKQSICFPNVLTVPGQVVELTNQKDIDLVPLNVKKGFIEVVDEQTPIYKPMPEPEAPKPPAEDAELMELRWNQIIPEVKMIKDIERLKRLARMAEDMDKPKSVKNAIADRIASLTGNKEPIKSAEGADNEG